MFPVAAICSNFCKFRKEKCIYYQAYMYTHCFISQRICIKQWSVSTDHDNSPLLKHFFSCLTSGWTERSCSLPTSLGGTGFSLPANGKAYIQQTLQSAHPIILTLKASE